MGEHAKNTAQNQRDHTDVDHDDDDFDVTSITDTVEAGGRILKEAEGSVKVAAGFWRWLLRHADSRGLREHLRAMDATELQIKQHHADDLALNNRKKEIAVKGAQTKARNDARKAREAEHEEQMKRLNDLIDLRFRRAAARKEAEAARALTLGNDERENLIAHEAWKDECRRALGDIAIGRISRNADIVDSLSPHGIDGVVEEGARRLFQAIEVELDEIKPPQGRPPQRSLNGAMGASAKDHEMQD